jgi:hypothetical protein
VFDVLHAEGKIVDPLVSDDGSAAALRCGENDFYVFRESTVSGGAVWDTRIVHALHYSAAQLTEFEHALRDTSHAAWGAPTFALSASSESGGSSKCTFYYTKGVGGTGSVGSVRASVSSTLMLMIIALTLTLTGIAISTVLLYAVTQRTVPKKGGRYTRIVRTSSSHLE